MASKTPAGGSARSDGGAPVIRNLPLGELEESPASVRLPRDAAASALLRSLMHDGQLEPIKVVPGRDRFRIVDGLRRTAAARRLGWPTIRAVIFPPMLTRELRKRVGGLPPRTAKQRAAERSAAIEMAQRAGFTANDIARLIAMDPTRGDAHQGSEGCDVERA